MLVLYEQDRQPNVGTPAWRDVFRFWLAWMELYSADCARAGVDNLDPSDLRYRRSYVASFMHDLVTARTAAERERILAEAAAWLEQQEHRVQLTSAPMKVVGSSSGPTARPLKALIG